MTPWFSSSLTALAAVALTTITLYFMIIVFARFSGVRSFAQMSTYDIAVVIALGSLIATTAASKTPSLAQGVVAISVLYLTQLAVSRLRSRFRLFEAATDNRPILLMGAGGEMKYANMRVARVTEDDIRTHLWQANVLDLSTVHAMIMGGTGKIHVLHGTPANDDDIRWLLKHVRDYS